jgi:adenylate cyclase
MDSSAGGPSTDVREAELTVMFTDIIGFTPLSEHMPPADVATMLNRHFEMLNACIEAEGGTLDKYIGDATMAFWGAPEAVPDHAARACRTALAIAAALEKEEASGASSPVRIKIALHTGPLIVGNIGARSRMNYTVIGDTVNVCSRLESLTGEFDEGRPVTILVSGEVVAAAGDGFLFEPLGERTVKGRARPVEIWRLKGAKP